jgi:putative membrane protein
MTSLSAAARRYLVLILKGMAMGAADVVPGVSGGTIAFISGIYEELIESLRKIDITALQTLRNQGPVAAWHWINGNFLLAIFAGVAVSLFSLANVITYAMETWPILVWAFFFGLVLASVIYVSRQLERWRLVEFVCLLGGVLLAAGITAANPAQLPDSWWMLTIAGAIAICAMILPGISGSFILLLMGLYSTFLHAISSFDVLSLASFGIGCVVGLLAFSHLLSWLLRHYHGATLATLTGFLLGSLQMIWPWKQTLRFYENRHGELEPLIQENVLPGQYAVLTDQDPQVLGAIVAALIGVALVLGLELMAQKGHFRNRGI